MLCVGVTQGCLAHARQCMMNVYKRKKNLRQPISDTRHANDATQLVALRPIRHAHISICLVSALCQWLKVYLYPY